MTGSGQGPDPTNGRPKTLVVCCDGTWNDPYANTNIWRIYRTLCRAAMKEPEKPKIDGEPVTENGTIRFGTQTRDVVLYYDTGVGTEKWNRLRGGGLARGLPKNIVQAYSFLVDWWDPGDQIFCFGFSRGAFTVRSLCGMIGAEAPIEDDPKPRQIGILDRAHLKDAARERAIELAFQYYRTAPADRPDFPRLAELGALPMQPASIRFLGVFDTVGSLGIASPALIFLNKVLLRRHIGFHDTRLGKRIEWACQALALHERRGAFKPVVWSHAPGFEPPEEEGQSQDQKVLQVWFTGAHGDVGGGYEDDDLSCISLRWMLRCAVEAGLPLDGPQLDCERVGNALGPRHDSESDWLGRLLGGANVDSVRSAADMVPRAIGWPLKLIAGLLALLRVPPYDRRIGEENRQDDDTYAITVNEQIHESVLARYRPDTYPPSIKLGLERGIEVVSDFGPHGPGQGPSDHLQAAE